jgi:hypothetical protein
LDLAIGRYKGRNEKVQVFTLAGHTHDFDIFQMEDDDKVRWYQNQDWVGVIRMHDFGDRGLHITTSSAGPPGDGVMPKKDVRENLDKALPYIGLLHDGYATGSFWSTNGNDTYLSVGDRIMRAPGGRLVAFDRTSGKLIGLDELSVDNPHFGDS